MQKTATRIAGPRFGYVRWSALITLSALACVVPAVAQDNPDAAKKSPTLPITALWNDPGDIKSRDLFYGPGGKEHQPQGPMKFVEEDTAGSNPKFDLKDSNGDTWKAKLGVEAQPETAAVRLLWAVGYFADADYFVPELKVDGMPALKRGGKVVDANGNLKNVRLKYRGGKKEGTWKWDHNPFEGTRELNGLRVMMALLNNWDIKDENNAIYKERKKDQDKDEAKNTRQDNANQDDNKENHKDQDNGADANNHTDNKKTNHKKKDKDDDGGGRIYLVSDVGSSFGTTGYHYYGGWSKNDLGAYSHSTFISHVHSDYVDFNEPTHPPFIYVFGILRWARHIHERGTTKHIPRADAKWIGGLLAQLTPQQIRDAFRAAGYTDAQIDILASTVRDRIAQLNQL